MKKVLKNKIQEAITDLERLGGLKDPEMKKVVDKLKKVIEDNGKSNK
ncbi:MAG: hypothetical protein AABY15_07195 [Nanoarchaeota archaeon]